MLFLHRNNRMELLLEELGDLLSVPRAHVFRPEVVVVQSLGMERWLAMGLSKRFGVWANAQHPFPRAFIEQSLDAIIGPVAREKCWSRESMTFHLAAILAELPAYPSLGSLAGYLEELSDVESRLELAREIADAFDQAQIYRPEWFLSWASQSTEFAADDFRPPLFRLLLARLGENHFPARLAEFERRLPSVDLSVLPLPSRVSLFAVAAMPPAFLHIFDLLSTKLTVHWFLLTASREYLGEELAKRELARHVSKGHDFSFAGGAMQPLLGSYGRMMRDLALLVERDCNYADQGRLDFVEPECSTVLSTLQADLCALRRRGDTGSASRLPLRLNDESLQIHACHGPRRELEVLREILIDAFERDPTLVPEDVIVLLRDVDVYAPLVDAVFTADRSKPGYIPFTLADRAIGAANVLAEALAHVLDLSSRRLTVADLSGVLDYVPVLERYGIEVSELPKIRRWLAELGATWGTDVAERQLEGLPEQAEHTLRFALSRLILGTAMDACAPRPFAGLSPFDVEGDDAVLAGRFVDCAESLFAWREQLMVPRSIEQWQTLLGELIESFFAVPSERGWQATELAQAIEQLSSVAVAAGFSTAVPVRYLAKHLAEHFENTRSARAFLSGGVTFCAMLPMRGVPAKIVAMLGLDDGSFPRVARVSSFDAIAREPRVGDRLLREEDRHLFLESLLAARDRFIVTYTGRSARDDSPRPPSVVIEELVSVIDESFYVANAACDSDSENEDRSCSSSELASSRLVVIHPMHGYSSRYFDGSDARLKQRSHLSYRAAQVLQNSRLLPSKGICQRLSKLSFTEVKLTELERFWLGPGEAFWQQRLIAQFEREQTLCPVLDPVELDGLGRWSLTVEQFRAIGRDETVEQLRSQWKAQGRSPVGALGDVLFEQQLASARRLRQVFDRLAQGRTEEIVDVRLRLGEVSVGGFIEQVFGGLRLDWGVTALSPKHRLRAWVRHLALCAEGRNAQTYLIRPASVRGRPVAVERLGALAQSEATVHLVQLLGYYATGMTAPLPFFPAVSYSYADRVSKGEPQASALERAYREYGDPLNDVGDEYASPPVGPEVARLFGDEPPISADWPHRQGLDGVPSFPELAEAVWGSCLAATQPLDAVEQETLFASASLPAAANVEQP